MAEVGQGLVELTLDETLDIAFGLTVPDQEQGHSVRLR